MQLIPTEGYLGAVSPAAQHIEMTASSTRNEQQELLTGLRMAGVPNPF